MRFPYARTACAALLLAVAPAAASASASAALGQSAPYLTIGSSAQSQLPQRVEIPTSGRFVLVDAASAQLFMIEDGRVRDTMRVIVGKPTAATPTIKSAIYTATLNPYWHVPADLARTIVAPRVLADGLSYLKERGYEVVSSFEGGRVLPASEVDWKAVAEGREQVFVRQRPGPANSMGQVKFSFPNADGIYLHDTPRKELFDEAQRNLSAGCVRLEDAQRLASWLLGYEPSAGSKQPEQDVRLSRPVPITIAYLDAPARVQLASL